MKRASGILMPVFSLPGKWGVGTLSSEAREFILKLERAGQSYWQVLPLGPTGYGDSPYQLVSSFAGNPYLIDLEELANEGLLDRAELDNANWGTNPEYVDYGKLWENKEHFLYKAYKKFCEIASSDKKNEYELKKDKLLDETKQYCLYSAIKKANEYKAWTDWDEDLKLGREEALERYKRELSDDIEFRLWVQVRFLDQWKSLKEFAHAHHVEIIGDIPIYAAFDSADAWASPSLFWFDEHSNPKAVAGCPPDYFSPDGQLWGNPLYNWEHHKQTGYRWWIDRLEFALTLYDYVRIDHFRGFDEYYSIPAGDTTARNGRWEKGPGMDIFDCLKEHFAGRYESLPIIAEDLGLLTDSVKELLKKSGFPGMRVIEFAFDSDSANLYLPHNYNRNTVVYTGTHDNCPLAGWIATMSDYARDRMIFYQGSEYTPKEKLYLDCIRTALSSIADTAIIPMQDLLGLGKEARLNTPGSLGDNWQWRLKKGQFTDELADYLNKLSRMYSR